MTNVQRLLENHLAFLASHRGTVVRRDGFVLVDSTSAEFTCAFAEEAASLDRLPERYHAVRLVPWSRIGEADLVARGFEQKGAFTYMTLSGPLPPCESVPGFQIDVVADARQMDAFTDVQTRAFLGPDDSFEWWSAWLGERNRQNHGNATQCFYLGSFAGVPAGVTLTVRCDDVVGIYAVATLAEHRKKGASTALLARAVDDAHVVGAQNITLQVKTGSYAEALYRKLGFVEAFLSPIFVRPS